MFTRTGSVLALLAAISLLPFTHADAGDRQTRHRMHGQHGIKLVDRSVTRRGNGDHRRFQRPRVVVINVDVKRGHRRHNRGDVNTYSGDVDIYSRRGVGEWSYGVLPSEQPVMISVPNAKIIDVSKLQANSACSMEAGVCVIRP